MLKKKHDYIFIIVLFKGKQMRRSFYTIIAKVIVFTVCSVIE
jgi:hypothetical protein